MEVNEEGELLRPAALERVLAAARDLRRPCVVEGFGEAEREMVLVVAVRFAGGGDGDQSLPASCASSCHH